jgi:hypothetical protein
VFAPKRGEVAGEWVKLHDEERRNLKWRRLRWARHVVWMGGKSCGYVVNKETRGKETTRKTKT